MGVAPNSAAHPPPPPLPSRGRGVTVERVLHELDLALSNRLKLWDEGRGFAAIRDAWSARALGLGEPVTVDFGQQHVAGTFTGLGSDGALILTEPSGKAIPIHSGEVKFATLERLRQSTP